jgi:hypothetical protein
MNFRLYEREYAQFSARIMETVTFEETTALVEDFSMTGLGLSTHEPLEVGSRVKVWVDARHRQSEVFYSGRVAWTRRDPDKAYRMGIELIDFRYAQYKSLQK